MAHKAYNIKEKEVVVAKRRNHNEQIYIHTWKEGSMLALLGPRESTFRKSGYKICVQMPKPHASEPNTNSCDIRKKR